MTKTEYRAGVSRVLYMLSEVFNGTVSDSLLDAWVAVMASEKVTMPELKTGAIAVMKSRKYNKVPPPSELLDVIRPRVDHRALAEAQADLVLEAVRVSGPYNKPELGDTTTAYLMASRWRWKTFASTIEIENTKWWRRDFVDAYQSAKETGHVKRLAPGDDSEALRRIVAKVPIPTPSEAAEQDRVPVNKEANMNRVADIIQGLKGKG